MAPMYYKEAHAIIIAFSLNSKESFENMENWISDVDENATTPNFIKIICGLKSDLYDEAERTSLKDGMKYAKAKNAFYFETSSKDGSTVDEMF